MTLSKRLKKSFSQQHMLVDLEYTFLNESFGLEIWHTCYQHRWAHAKELMAKNQFFSPWKGVKVGISENFPHNNTCW